MRSAAVALKRKPTKVYDSPEELALVLRAKRGDEGAFTQLYAHHLNRVRVSINRIVRDEDQSDWLANVALTKVWQKISTFNEQSKFSTWITRIAINEALMHLRKEECPSRCTGGLSLDALLDHGVAGSKHDHSFNPSLSNQKFIAVRDLVLEGVADRQVLDKAINRVPHQFRQILRLRIWEGHSLEEIRQLLSDAGQETITLPALKTRLLRGRLILQAQVDELS